MKPLSTLLLLIFLLSACRSIGHKYVTEEKELDCCTMEFPVGDSERKVQLSINFPMAKLTYSSPVEEAKDLRLLDMKFFIDGTELMPNSEKYSAAFFDAFRPEEYRPIAKEDCCSDLANKIGFNRSQHPDANTFAVEIAKTYDLQENRPPNIEVLNTAATDKKTYEKRWKLKLVTYERIDDPIRFH